MKVRFWAVLGAAGLINSAHAAQAAGAGRSVGLPPRPAIALHGCRLGDFCHRRVDHDVPVEQFGAGFREHGLQGAFADYSAAYDDELGGDHDLWFRVQEKFGPGDLGRKDIYGEPVSPGAENPEPPYGWQYDGPAGP